MKISLSFDFNGKKYGNEVEIADSEFKRAISAMMARAIQTVAREYARVGNATEFRKLVIPEGVAITEYQFKTYFENYKKINGIG